MLDRYLLAKTRQLICDVTSDLEALDSPLAAAKLRDFADVLTNWYVRRSRDRFWSGDDTAAFDTLYTVLETVARVAAPLLPLVTEEVWRGLTGGRTVHLEDWPDKNLFPEDDELVAAMDRVREIASVGLALRKAHGLRVRLPLAKVTVVGADGRCVRRHPSRRTQRQGGRVRRPGMPRATASRRSSRSTPARSARGSASRCSR